MARRPPTETQKAERGEQLEHLQAHGIRFEVVPGITAALACGAYAGIPLTHRDHAHACTFVTGHLRDDGAEPDWQALARPMQTLVVYMGLGALARIAERLGAHGMPPDTPAALVESGTLPGQSVIVSDLAGIGAGVDAAALTIRSLHQCHRRSDTAADVECSSVDDR